MALASFQIDPGAGGVSQETFDSHTHPYRKITRIGADSYDQWSSPTWVVVTDDGDTHASESVDLEAVGVTVSTEPTGTPI